MKLIDSALIDRLIRDAANSPRQRSHYNIHESLADTVQKLVVAATPRSYFRPHRHADKSELALVLRGQFAVFQYDDQGGISDCLVIGEQYGISGLEIPSSTWHSWLALGEENVFFETKQGPYDPATASEFAPWAPAEDTADVARYMKTLRNSI